jgi:hypothetical protein
MFLSVPWVMPIEGACNLKCGRCGWCIRPQLPNSPDHLLNIRRLFLIVHQFCVSDHDV